MAGVLSVLWMAILVNFFPARALFHRCPKPEDISPCSCKISGEEEVKLQCVRATGKEFKDVLSRSGNYIIDEVTLNDMRDLDMTSKLFRNVPIHNINIVNSNILTFALFKMLTSLHEVLNNLRVINSTVKTFQISTGSHFTRMESLIFESTNVVGIFSDLVSNLPKHLKKFKASGNTDFGIDVIRPEAFAKLIWLTELNLSHNRIVNIERNMFPRPARRLNNLNLGYNRITYLPDDFFEEMPRLEFLYLNHNPLLTLQWKVFKPVWHQLDNVYLQGIELICNCELAWVLRFRSPAALESPTCKSSDGTHVIADLSISDLCPSWK